MPKLYDLEDIDGEPRIMMDALFDHATKAISPTTVLDRVKLRNGLVGLWEKGFVRFVCNESYDEIKMEFLKSDGEWESVRIPQVH